MCAVIGVVAVTAEVARPASAADHVRNTLSLDYFSRVSASGWGKAETGGSYAMRGQTAAFAVSGNSGRISNLQPGRYAEAYLPSVSSSDTIVQTTVVAPSVPSGRRGVYVGLEARRQADGSAYRGKLALNPNGGVSLSVSRTKGAVETQLGAMPLSGSVNAGQQVWLQMMVLDTNPVVVKVRTWSVGASNPAWQLAVTDSSGQRISAAGSTGVWDYVSTNSVPTTLVHDQLRTTALVDAPVGKPSPSSSKPVPTSSTAPKTSAPPRTTAPVTTSAPPTTKTSTPPPVASPPASTVVYKAANFDGMALGKVVPTAFNTALGKTNTNAGAYDDMTVVADNRGGRSIRTTLLAGSIHSAPVADGGDNLFVNLPASYDSACLQYDVKFDSNFDWSLGGKLPGLEGVAPGVTPATPTGGDVTTLGWSGRMMWVTPKSYSWAGPTDMALSYMYHPGQVDKYGDNVAWGKSFSAGSWHTVKQCYTMNTVGKANGTLQAWMDGAQVVNNHSYVYRVRSDVHINYLDFSIFRGGNTMAWAGSRTGTVDIDNVLVTNK